VSLSLSLALAGSATGQTLPLTGEVLYGAPGGARVNIFPVMIIDPSTGGFANIFNNIAAPQFVCGGGSTAVGSQFLYVSLPAGCDNQVPKIIGYSLEPVTGVPTALKRSPFKLPTSASPQGLAATPDSNFLYVADATGSIYAFKVDRKTGTPKPIQGSPFASGVTYQLVVDPSGKYLYASDDDRPGGVLAFTIAPGGALTPVPGSPFMVPGATTSDYQPYGIVDTGKYAYIVLSGTNQIAGFSIDSATGALTPLSGSLLPTGNGPGPLVFSGNFLYTVNQLDGTISGYSIDPATGALAGIPGSPFGSDGWGLAADLSGRYLYLSAEKGVQGFNIDPATGALTEGAGRHGNNGGLLLTVVPFRASTLQ